MSIMQLGFQQVFIKLWIIKYQKLNKVPLTCTSYLVFMYKSYLTKIAALQNGRVLQDNQRYYT